MRPIDADALIVELQKDETLFDNEAVVARENSIKYTDNYAKIMWSRANGIRDAIVEVYDAPTIDVDGPRGEWIKKYNGNGWNDFWDYTCSNCGEKYERADAVLYNANYCPNCRARMKGANDEKSV